MSPGPQGTSLGVDFGTSHTIAVVRRADGSLRPLLFDGSPLMPSAVCAAADGGLLVGRDAVHAGRRHPERFEPNPKRLIDRPSTLLGAREYPVPDLIAAVLDAVAAECRRVVGNPAQVTLTVPAEWGPARRQVVEDAASRAGLGQVRLVPEPVAAATYYAEALKHRTAVGASIVVYDLGAGTFDASVVRRTEHGFETVALDGRGDLGGLDIDAALIEHLGETYGDREGWKRLVNPSTVEERRHFRDFQEEVRGAKERLSRHQQSDIAIPLLDVEAHLTRTELEQIAHPHLEQTIRVTQAVIRAAGLDLAASAGVFLVGGASRMPLVATMLHRALGVAPTVLDQPEVVVAEGSVLWTQAGQHTTTFPIQRTPQQPGFAPAPLTPSVAHLAPPSPQTAPAPQAPQQIAPTPVFQPSVSPQAAPSPQEPAALTAPQPETSPQRNLPPQTRSPLTPPLSAEDPDEPPRTEAERQRAKKVGRRGIIAFILVDILIIAALVWYFSPRDDPFDEGGGAFDDREPAVSSFEADWSTAEAGTLLSSIEGTHDGAVESVAFLDGANGPQLFSSGADGSIEQWDLVSGTLIDEYWPEANIGDLWPAFETDDEGNSTPIMVALTGSYEPWVWRPDTQEFTSAGKPEMVDEEAQIGFVRIAYNGGSPALALLNEYEFELFDLTSGETIAHFPIPDGYGYPRFFNYSGGTDSEIVAFDGNRSLDIVDPYYGTAYGEPFTSADWEGNSVSAFTVVYHWGTPYAMAYGSDDRLHFWDLDAKEPAWMVPYDDPHAEFHFELADSPDGTVLLSINNDRVAEALNADTADTVQFEAPAGMPTELASVTVDSRHFAVTGDDQGNIRFWSLGN